MAYSLSESVANSVTNSINDQASHDGKANSGQPQSRRTIPVERQETTYVFDWETYPRLPCHPHSAVPDPGHLSVRAHARLPVRLCRLARQLVRPQRFRLRRVLGGRRRDYRGHLRRLGPHACADRAVQLGWRTRHPRGVRRCRAPIGRGREFVWQHVYCTDGGGGKTELVRTLNDAVLYCDKIIIVSACADHREDKLCSEVAPKPDAKCIDVYIFARRRPRTASSTSRWRDDDPRRVCPGRDSKSVSADEFEGIIECLLPCICEPPTVSPTALPIDAPTLRPRFLHLSQSRRFSWRWWL